MPVAPSVPPAVGAPTPSAGESLRALLPTLPMRGLWNGVLLALLAAFAWVCASFVARLREPLPERGVVPAILRTLETGARVGVVFFALGVIAAWIPASLAPSLPWVVVAGAVAVGWSARDVLPDFMGWLFLSMEGTVSVGHWIVVDGHRGQVVWVGLRATRLRDALGSEHIVPNRRLVGAEPLADEGSWPVVEVRLRVPAHVESQRVLAAVHEAIALSSWSAPGPVEVRRGESAGTWTVRCLVLHGAWANALQRTLQERVLAVLSEAKGPSGAPDATEASAERSELIGV